MAKKSSGSVTEPPGVTNPIPKTGNSKLCHTDMETKGQSGLSRDKSNASSGKGTFGKNKSKKGPGY